MQVTAEGLVDAPQLPNTEELLEILEELQKSVEDLDNARDFHTIGGFAIMVDVLADGDGYSGRAPPVDVAPAHFDRDAIKGHAAWVLGTAIKNQADLQTAALGSNAMEPLLRLLKGVKQNPRGSAKGMYALGALLRNHEAAQRHFVELGGVQTLLNLLDITFFEPAESRQVLRRRHIVGIKVIALIEDLMVDSHSSPLLEQLSGERCCNQLVQVLSKCQTNNEFEKVFRALDAARKGCAQSWSVAPSTAEGLEVLRRQSQEWRAEISKDDDEDYLRDLVGQAEELIRMIRVTH